MKRGLKLILFIGAFAVAGVACGGGGKEAAKQIQLGSLAVSDHGTKDVSGASSAKLEVDDFYFEPTFLRGTPGQKVKVSIENESKTLHNLSIAALQIDKDIPGKAKLDVDLTFPDSGVLLFLCKYHTGQGMNGELLAGQATPQAAAAAPPTVKIAESASLGKLLTDGQGLTLYTFKNDVSGSGKSAVSGQLANAWPPLILASGNPVKPQGLSGDLSLITRDDGSRQIAYKGQPLYRYARDTAAGDTNGQGVGGVWFVAAP